MSGSTESVTPDGYVKTEHGFRFKRDPVDRSLAIIIPARHRGEWVFGGLLALGGGVGFMLFGAHLINQGLLRTGKGIAFCVLWFGFVFLIAVIGAWLLSRELLVAERIRITPLNLVHERRVLGVATACEYDASRISRLRRGPCVQTAQQIGPDGMSGLPTTPPREIVQGIAFDYGPKYVRLARSLEYDEPAALIKLIRAVRPELVDPHEAFELAPGSSREAPP